jgi:hypothetical protein
MKAFDKQWLQYVLSVVETGLLRQRDIGRELIEQLNPVITSKRWQIEVLIANLGSRILLLSPNAVLKMKGETSLPPLPCTASTSIGDNAGRYLVIKPQIAEPVTFLSDFEISEQGPYAQLVSAYDANILSCKLVLKQEEVRRLWTANVAVTSPWVSFGTKLPARLKEEVLELSKTVS